MNYWLHPEAATEHEEQVAYYEAQARNLGRRYHAAFLKAMAGICKMPKRFTRVKESGIRRASIKGFPHNIIFRVSANGIQVLAIAHHRRRPGYWQTRL